MSSVELNVNDHDRNSAGMHYVYPVVSRRAGGVSVGINLNTNNACNWRCIYCQVPNLTLGTAPAVNMALLEKELREFLNELMHGDFMQQRVPVGARRINDIALSGNGEPTSAQEFLQVIDLIERVRQDQMLPQHVKLVLITNGSLMHRPYVQQGIKKMSGFNGEVWFKLDRASASGMEMVNHTLMSMEKVANNLKIAIELCPTWLQTCWFAIDGNVPSKNDEDDYLNFVRELRDDHKKLQGVLLYTLARPSLQPGGAHLEKSSNAQLEVFAERIRSLGLIVKVSA